MSDGAVEHVEENVRDEQSVSCNGMRMSGRRGSALSFCLEAVINFHSSVLAFTATAQYRYHAH